MNKIFPSAAEALKGVVADGQLMAVGGFGLCGIPEALIDALRDSGVPDNDWVLVHDAARCLVTPQEICALIDACRDDAVGGLLALPLPDTLKAEAGGRVQQTVPREHKWLAQTPQMFRLGDLHAALARARASGFADITDEASAIERSGAQPRLVEGRASNLKVTYPHDFALAEAILRSRT